MRAFIAIEIPKEVKDILYSLQNKQVSGFSKINWVHKKNLHLTLKFLADLPEDKLEKIKSLLKEIRFKRFDVSLGDLGFFPSEDYIKIVWVSLEPEVKIMELQQEIDSKLSEFFKLEDRFAVHLTLGRVKFIKDAPLFRNIMLNQEIKKLKFEVSGFSLIRSELTKNGPKYELLEKF